MKDFILDLTYKDAAIVNSNDEIYNIPSNNLPYKSIPHHTINLGNTGPNYTTNHNKSSKFNIYNSIDCL